MSRKRGVSEEEARQILSRCTYGVLSTVGADGQPYGIPLNYVYAPGENALYFHCAKTGRKLENIRSTPRGAFAAVGSEEIVPEQFTTRYESVIAEGTISEVNEPEEKRRVLRLLCARLAPAGAVRRETVIEKWLPAVTVLRMDLETLAGKRNAGE